MARTVAARSEETRVALLDAAQELFADVGIEGASLRAIQRLAGVAPGTLQYHFASKGELLAALLARQHAGLNAKVSERAARLKDRKARPDARALIEVLAGPYSEFVEADSLRGPRHLQILAQMVHAGDPKIRPLLGDLPALYDALLERAYPKATRARRHAALAVAARALLLLLAGWALDHKGKKGGAADLDAIIVFAAGGMDALMD